MNTKDFFKIYFDTALKIHETTEKLGYSVDYARLFTYIYLKLKDNNGKYEYFEQKNQLEIDVLLFLMNDKKLNFGPKIEKYFQSLQTLPQTLSNLDHILRQDLGMEIRIKSELLNRYRLHTDSAYRKKILAIYKGKIVPSLEKQKKAA
ncbi:MAG: hypothetical protein PVI26_00825 [Chitinispirillia bacterium]|jgi:hypothetical protein